MKSSFNEVKSIVTTLEGVQKATQSDLEKLQKHVIAIIPKQHEKLEQKFDKVESSITDVSDFDKVESTITDVSDLYTEITQVRDSTDTAFENYKGKYLSTQYLISDQF